DVGTSVVCVVFENDGIVLRVVSFDGVSFAVYYYLIVLVVGVDLRIVGSSGGVVFRFSRYFAVIGVQFVEDIGLGVIG
ncbi:hypothetical protein, partial [Pseudomonas aeruginosa]|uniref:hypothetical protein n=1 Tax=Pseudomonas aeruginosa TaxID=287 RepID=UPI003CC6C220